MAAPRRRRTRQTRRLRLRPTKCVQYLSSTLPVRSQLSHEIYQERKEADTWKDGAKSGKPSKEEKEEKRKAELARKAENARLLAEEEASAPPKPKPAPKAGAKKQQKPSKPAGPGAIAAGGAASGDEVQDQEVESYAATGIDNALDLLDVVTAKMDKASVGQQAAGIERHPEVISHSDAVTWLFTHIIQSFVLATI